MLFNQDAEIPGFKAGDECGEDYPAEYRKNIEEIFVIFHDAGSYRKETPGFSPERFIEGGEVLDDKERL